MPFIVPFYSHFFTLRVRFFLTPPPLFIYLFIYYLGKPLWPAQ